MLKHCRECAKSLGVYLEVGAGSGVYAGLVRDSGVFDRVLAIEPAAALAADCRNIGLETLEMPIERAKPLKTDVAASFEVLEHLFSPRDFVRHMHAALAPGGLCILTTPNGLGPDVR